MVQDFNFDPFPASISVVVCAESKVSLLFDQAEKAKVLRAIIKIGSEVTAEEQQKSKETGVAIYTFKEVEVSVVMSQFLNVEV